jgi:hypothetical protein
MFVDITQLGDYAHVTDAEAIDAVVALQNAGDYVGAGSICSAAVDNDASRSRRCWEYECLVSALFLPRRKLQMYSLLRISFPLPGISSDFRSSIELAISLLGL